MPTIPNDGAPDLQRQDGSIVGIGMTPANVIAERNQSLAFSADRIRREAAAMQQQFETIRRQAETEARRQAARKEVRP